MPTLQDALDPEGLVSVACDWTDELLAIRDADENHALMSAAIASGITDRETVEQYRRYALRCLQAADLAEAALDARQESPSE